MKKALSIMLVAALCLAMLAGCGGQASAPSGTAPGGSTAPAGGRQSIIRITADNTPKIDPAVGNDYISGQVVPNLYDSLVYQRGDKQEPNLATKWGVSDNGLEYTFQLKQGVKFHDGSELKASDVVFSLKRWQAIGEGFAYLFENVVDCAATDDYTVKMTLGHPQGAFMNAVWHLSVLNEELVMANLVKDGTYGEFGDYGKNFLLSHDAGSGPYVATEMVQQDYFLATRFPDWHMGWTGREKAPEQFKAIYCTEPSTQFTMMSNQELEITSPWFAPENYEALCELPGVEMFNYTSAITQYVFFNCAKAPTDDVNYRKGLACLIDYDSLIGPVFAEANRSVGPISSYVSGHADVMQYQYDLEKAKEYFEKSKYADSYKDTPIECFLLDANPALEKMMLSLQANCLQVGITMNIQKGTWLSFQESVTKPETELHVQTCNITPSVNDAATAIETLYSSKTQGTFENPCWIATPEMDARIADAVATVDTAERNKKAAELQKYIVEELCPAAYVADLTQRVAYQSSYVDWPQANRFKESGKLEYFGLGLAYYFPDMSVYTDR